MCDKGSATPKNISPMPIPALNIIATHDTVLNSGCSSCRYSSCERYSAARVARELELLGGAAYKERARMSA